jgi:acyl-CoA dehydrogenase
MNLDLAPETVRFAEELREWAVQEVRPFARDADRLHNIPDLAAKVIDLCPIPGTPVGGLLDYPRRGQPDFDPANADGKHLLGSALVESLLYGDVLALVLCTRGESLADRVVRTLGTPEQVAQWIDPIDRGEYNLMAFAMTEPSGGSDPASMKTTATKTDAGWLLNGHKHFCSNGAVADLLLVFATVDSSLGYQGIRAFVVPRATPGVTTITANENKSGLRCMMTTEFSFENVLVPLDSMMGDGGQGSADGLKSGLRALNSTRGYMASMSIGIAQAIVDEGRTQLKRERTSFSPQRWNLIEDEFDRMDSGLQRGRVLTRRFASLFDAGQPYKRAASVAKAYTCPLAERISLRVLQHLGTWGYTEDSLVEKWNRDLKIVDIWEGTQNIQRIVIGRELRATRA